MNNKDNINIIDDISTILENIEEITPEQKLKNIEELLKIYKSQEVYKRRKRIAIKALNNPPSITNLLIKSAKDGEDTENPHHVYLGGAIFTQIYSAQKNKLITKSVLTEIVEEFEKKYFENLKIYKTKKEAIEDFKNIYNVFTRNLIEECEDYLKAEKAKENSDEVFINEFKETKTLPKTELAKLCGKGMLLTTISKNKTEYLQDSSGVFVKSFLVWLNDIKNNKQNVFQQFKKNYKEKYK
jgi:hypothetical protein